MFIASSEYIAKKADGALVELTVNIGVPEPDPVSNGVDYRCKVEVIGISFSEYSYGVDAIQSLCLVVQCIKYVFEPLKLKGWKFYFPHDLDHEIDLISAILPRHT